MPQITDLNVVPYYDDFDQDDLFHRILFRPGYAVQARELTQLQSILQNQVERHGNHMFKEGAMVIPGQVSYSDRFDTLQLESTFAGETIKPESFYNATTPVIITGVTSGVKAKVIGFQAATTTTQPILYIYYIQTGTDLTSGVFSNSENITADASVTHTTTYGSGVASGTTFSSNASQTGSSVKVDKGIYFIRGQFVQCAEQTLPLSVNSTTETARIGFTVTEELITPEIDATLTDNATGSSNYAAKGAHRLKVSLTLSKLDFDSTADTNFIELMRIDNGVIVSHVQATEYSVLGDTLARRTFDESGDYTVVPFIFDAKESVDTTVKGQDFTGTYTAGATTNDGNTASESLFTLSVSPGKAYVKGYEVEQIATKLIDIDKARDFQTINAGVTNLEVGNTLRLTNVFGTPDISNISGETTPYSQIGLFTERTTTRGSSAGRQIGVTRARFMEFEQGQTPGATSSNTESVYKLSVFDTQMFTTLTMSGTPSATLLANHSNGGVQVTGNTSGATGFVFPTGTSGDKVILTQVVGKFSAGEKIKASDSSETDLIVEDATDTDLTIVSIETNQLREARQIQGGSTTTNFSADILLERTDDDAVFRGGGFNNDADPVDRIVFETGNTDAQGFAVGLEVQEEAKVRDSEKSIAVFKLPKEPIKTLKTESNSGASDTSFNARTQFVATSNASGVVTLSAGTNETFVTFAEKDYLVSIITAGTGSGAAGDIVSASGNTSGTGTQTLTITDNTVFGSGAKVKVLATLTKSAQQPKIKTTQLMKQLKVTTGATDAFGTRPADKTISFGRADVFRLNAVFDSEDTSTDATAPTLTISSATGVFERGERITGGTSGAKGRLITTASPLQYVLIGGFGATDFIAGETITGVHSGATATIDTGGVTAGSKVITSNFTLDNGQRDTYYDISRLVRKPGVAAPRGRLLIVYDFFEHGAGDFFSVDSYSSVSGQMNYADIPDYSATKIDPDDPEPSGSFELRNSVDFRPTVSNVTGASTVITAVDEITGNSFNHTNRTFDSTGAVVVDTPQPGAAMTNDFEFFLNKFASVFLLPDGEFKVVEGVSAEDPTEPKDIDNAMKLATIYIPAFTEVANGMKIQRYKTQRFTMRDIGRLQERIENLEFYTALNLLERDAESFQIQDANGLDRFKSGFIVDNFSGHKVGDTLNKDYKIAIDMEENEARPICVMRNSSLTELATTDTARASAGYQKTGDLLTLPYTHEELIKQPYATRVENVQTYLIQEWVGKITLSPSGDEWFETEEAPALIINREGNFDSVKNALKNSGALGTVWNNWETQWSGVVSTKTERTSVRTTTTGRWGQQVPSVRSGTRTTTTSRTDLKRTGVRTSVVEHVEHESQGKRIISRALIPFVRPRTITITGECFRPGTRLYAYFDRTAVSQFITPSSSEFSDSNNPVEGSALVTNGAGKVEFTFRIPEYRFAGQQAVPKFKSGDVEFRLTSSSTDDRSTLPLTAGQEIYTAKGVIETEQETIISTRNARVVQTSVNQTTSKFTSTSTIRENRPASICFIAGTKVLLENGDYKDIEHIVVGDRVLNSKGSYNTVIHLQHAIADGRKLVSINDGEFFFTEDHPIMTNNGWKVVNPEMANDKPWYKELNTTEFKLGDEIVTHDGNSVVVNSIQTKDVDSDTPVYNFSLDGDKTYYANGWLVHNRCFRGETKVLLEGGIEKNIEDVEIGDKLVGQDGMINEVLQFHRPLLGDDDIAIETPLRMVSLNNGGYDASEDHMFLTTDGWKAPNAEKSKIIHKGVLDRNKIELKTLEIGDMLIGEGDKTIEVTSIEYLEDKRDLQLYNFVLTGNHTYMVKMKEHDEFIVVHNKGGDPLAQTFITYKRGGSFLTKLDLFFSEKDNDLPVWVEVRNVINGYPGPKLLPFGRKVLEPSDVTLDPDNGLAVTTFTFDSPVYIQEGTEYCFVVMSNSLDYKLWIAQMGEKDVSGSNRLISTQPHLGSLFKSQNNTTWDAVQSQDMKFTLHAANFSTTPGTVTLQNDIIGQAVTNEIGSTVYGARLLSNPIILTNSSAVAKVKHRDHGMYSTSNNVTITGVTSGISTTLDGAITDTATTLTLTSSTNFPSSGTVHIKISNEIMSGTISGTTLSSITRGQGGSTAVAHSDDATIELYMINSVPLTEINKTHTAIANIQMDSYTIALSTSASVTGASTDTEVGGINVYASENYRYELTKTVLNTMEVEDTVITAAIKGTTATSPSGTETSFTKETTNTFVPIGENFEHDISKMVASNINEANEMSSVKSLETILTLNTTNSNVSPVIDLDRASTVLVANRLDNIDSSSDVYPTSDYAPSTEPDGDNNSAIYITKSVQLENPATALRVFFSANKVNTSEIKVLFKILRTDDTSSLDELGYTFFNDTGLADTVPPNSLGKDDFQEYSFSAGIKDDGIGDALDEFISFQIKIVMQGTDAANPPRIKDLRAIALAT
jgi:hypothetical protein